MILLGIFSPPLVRGLGERGSGSLRSESNYCKTLILNQNTESVVYRLFLQACGNHPINSNLAIVTGVDEESIKSTSIYPELITHLTQLQGTVGQGSGRGRGCLRHIPSLCEQVRGLISNCLPQILSALLALNSSMILGYKIGNIITALYSQSTE